MKEGATQNADTAGLPRTNLEKIHSMQERDRELLQTPL